MQILPLEPADQKWIQSTMIAEWGDEMVIVHGEKFLPAALAGYKAIEDEITAGLITFNIVGVECEVITLNSFLQGKGVGDALLKRVEEYAREQGCRECMLITTNDNLHALEFYQKRGYYYSQVFPEAVNESRKIKPAIPLVAENGIPIRDEIMLKKSLDV